MPEASADQFARAHRRFAKAAFSVYAATAVGGMLLLLTSLVTDRKHDEDQISHELALETQLRARFLDDHLSWLASELHRLGTRTELDLLDDNLEPERSLLNLRYGKSAFFDVGVAIVDGGGKVVWAEPSTFMAPNASFAHRSWFEAVRATRSPAIVPVDPDEKDALVYVAAPVMKGSTFTGALVGGFDLARGPGIGTRVLSRAEVLTVLATARGDIVYPPVPPRFATEPSWLGLFATRPTEPFLATEPLDGRLRAVAGAPINLGQLVLLSVVDHEQLYAETTSRFGRRLVTGIVLALLPFGVLLMLLQRSLAELRRAEDKARRDERLKRMGEAANVIAHEVRNSLNGLRVGLDLVLRGSEERSDRVVKQLRAEIERLSDFSQQLTTFAKDPTPKLTRVDVTQILESSLTLTRELAGELGIELVVRPPARPIQADLDPAFLRIILNNLLSNAMDAVSSMPGLETPRVTVSVGEREGLLEIRVEDNGPGIAPEIESQIFEPFVSGKSSGVGIGLAVSRKIAQSHGGDLLMAPSEEGASFVLRLPLEGR